MSKKVLLKFNVYEWQALEYVGFSDSLVSIDDDCIYYNGEYICPFWVPHEDLFHILHAYCKGYKIGFQAGDDSRADYDFQNYVMFEKEAFERGDIDEHFDNS